MLKKSLLVVDCDTSAQRILRGALTAQYNVICAGTFERALEQVNGDCPPGRMIVDMDWRELEALLDVALHVGIRVLVLSSRLNSARCLHLARRAVPYVSKPLDAAHALDCAGLCAVPRKLIEPAQSSSQAIVLSAREQQVLDLARRGLTAKETADLLQVSPRTVDTYTQRIFDKFDVRSMKAAIARASTVTIQVQSRSILT